MFKKYSVLPENLFGLLFWNFLSINIIISIIAGLLTLFDIEPMEFSGKPTYGILGFIVAILMAPLMAVVEAASSWIFLKLGNIILRLLLSIRKA